MQSSEWVNGDSEWKGSDSGGGGGGGGGADDGNRA